jgi:hypothetical protein
MIIALVMPLQLFDYSTLQPAPQSGSNLVLRKYLLVKPKGFSASAPIPTAPACLSEEAQRPKNLKKSEILRCAQDDKFGY